MSKFTEEKLELAFIELLEEQGISYQYGKDIERDESEVLLKKDLKEYLATRYQSDNITDSEITQIVRKLETYPASDLYDTNKSIMKLVSDGFIFKREDATQKDIHIQFIVNTRTLGHPYASTLGHLSAKKYSYAIVA